MAQSGYTPIQLYHSTSALATPLAADLAYGELAFNVADGKIYYKDLSNTVQLLTAAGSGGGTVTSVNGSGGTTGLTLTGGPISSVGTLTLGGTLGFANGGTGNTSYTNGQLLIGNTATGGLTKATLTAGSNITITNGNGSITIASTGGGGGGVSSVGATAPATSTGGSTPNIGIAHSGGACTTTTGTGDLVFGTSPTLVTPNLGTPSAINLSNASGLTSGQVTTALGYTPYNATNPNGYVTSSGSVAFATSAGSAGSASTAGTAGGLTGTPNISVGSISASGITSTGGFNFAPTTSWAYNGSNTVQLAIGGSNAGTFTTSSASFPGDVVSNSGGGYARIGSSGVALYSSSTGMFGTSNTLGWNINGSGAATLSQAGDYSIAGQGYKPGGGSWAASSDARLKDNATPLTGALAKIAALNPVSYSWKYKTSEPTVGFIAQEVQSVLPAAVSETEATEDQKQFVRDGKVLAIGFQNDMTAYLVAAIKELKAEVDSLKAQLAAK